MKRTEWIVLAVITLLGIGVAAHGQTPTREQLEQQRQQLIGQYQARQDDINKAVDAKVGVAIQITDLNKQIAAMDQAAAKAKGEKAAEEKAKAIGVEKKK